MTIPEQNIPLLLEVTQAMGIDKESIVIKDSILDWHKQILQERMEEYKSGNAEISSWEDFKKELDKEDEEEV